MCSIFCNLSYHIRQHDLLNVNVWATHGVRLWVLVWLCVPFIFVKWKCDISRYSDHRIYTTLHVTTFLFIFHQISPRLRLDPVASWKPITSEVPWREEFFWSRMKFREKVGTYLVVSWNGGTPSHHPNFILGFSLTKTINLGVSPLAETTI